MTTMREQEGGCELIVEGEDSAIEVDVKLSDGWSDKPERLDRLRQSITKNEALPSQYAASATALASGAPAVASGMAMARAKVGDEWIMATEPLSVEAEGTTTLDIDFDIEDPERAYISSAVLLLTETYAEVAGENAEDLDSLTKLGSVLTLPLRLGPSLIFDATVAGVGNFDTEASIEMVQEAEISPAVEAKVEVYSYAQKSLSVSDGLIDEPADEDYAELSVKAGLISATGRPGVGVSISSQSAASVSANGLFSRCYGSALWACVWAGCCKSEEGTKSKWGLRAKLKFVIPEVLGGECPDDAESLISKSIENQLMTLLNDAFEVPPCDREPEQVEAALRNVLLIWQEWMDLEWGLFSGAQFDELDEYADEEWDYLSPDDDVPNNSMEGE